MDPLPLAILLFAAGVVLLLAEVALPAHGVIGLLGAAAIVAGVGVVFYLNQWAGLALAAALTVATPFAIGLWVKVWPRTPMGRRLILSAPRAGDKGHRPADAAPAVRIGQAGVAVSELRLGGTCEIAGERLGCRAEHELIPRGTPVRVIAIVDGHPIVRPA
jgi:membrane-bound serine protease (ClpP class)